MYLRLKIKTYSLGNIKIFFLLRQNKNLFFCFSFYFLTLGKMQI